MKLSLKKLYIKYCILWGGGEEVNSQNPPLRSPLLSIRFRVENFLYKNFLNFFVISPEFIP